MEFQSFAVSKYDIFTFIEPIVANVEVEGVFQ